MINWFEFFREKERRILFHGASVTVQKDGFRSELVRCISTATARAHSELVNGVGGVGSLFCLANLDYLNIHQADCDVVFYECFTGDTNTGITPIGMLGDLLEAFLLRFVGVPVVFILNTRQDRKLSDLDSIALIYSRIAEKYSVQCISVYKIFSGDGGGIMPGPELFRDGVHPTKLGATAIASEIWNALRERPVLSVVPPLLLVQSRKFLRLRLLSIHEVSSLLISGNVKLSSFEYNNTGQKFYYGETAGGIEINLSAYRVWGFLSLIGPKSPSFVDIEVNKKIRKFRTFDRNCFYTRPQTYTWEGFGEGVSLKMNLNPEKPDFGLCSRVSPDFETERSFMLCGFYVTSIE